ncbi:MAG: PAS domain-containing protein [Alphaproteobacteria bacterium HGW-Alphaproteobacteria-11]|nr:MAG: PAS domain-containing protein [Alphaproteobacteria bacterium HGW-Alphaproteobacteria-11]
MTAELFWDRRLDGLYAHWLEKKGGRLAPTRADFNPSEIKPFLPIVNFLDVRWEPLGFRHRLVGTEIVEHLGRDATGCWVDADLYGKAADRVFASLLQVAREARPYRRRSPMTWHPHSWLTMESMELPLVDEDGRVNMILRGVSYSSPKDPPPDHYLVAPLPLH